MHACFESGKQNRGRILSIKTHLQSNFSSVDNACARTGAIFRNGDAEGALSLESRWTGAGEPPAELYLVSHFGKRALSNAHISASQSDEAILMNLGDCKDRAKF